MIFVINKTFYSKNKNLFRPPLKQSELFYGKLQKQDSLIDLSDLIKLYSEEDPVIEQKSEPEMPYFEEHSVSSTMPSEPPIADDISDASEEVVTNKEMDPKDNVGAFAQKYQSRKDSLAQKKSTFTSQNLENQSQKQYADQVDQFSKGPPKKVDPQKKMLASLIYLVRGVDDGRNAWYYVLVDRLKVKMFLKALNDDIIHLENYGVILYSAYGDDPPEEVTQALKDEYGISG
jgi:hypothetical protein